MCLDNLTVAAMLVSLLEVQDVFIWYILNVYNFIAGGPLALHCEDNVVAGVKACRFLVDDIIALAYGELQHLDLLRGCTVIQGDILPVFEYFSFSSRLRGTDLLEDLEHVHRTASRFFFAARWRWGCGWKTEGSETGCGRVLTRVWMEDEGGRVWMEDGGERDCGRVWTRVWVEDEGERD